MLCKIHAAMQITSCVGGLCHRGTKNNNVLLFCILFKVLIHIADAPCHGRKYHSMSDDDYPDYDEDGRMYKRLMKKIRSHHIDYWFGYIVKENTDKMISVFNTYLQEISKQKQLICQFDAMNPSKITEEVHCLVTASIIGFSIIKRSNYQIDPSIPDWNGLVVKKGLRTKYINPVSDDVEYAISHIGGCSIDVSFKSAQIHSLRVQSALCTTAMMSVVVKVLF